MPRRQCRSWKLDVTEWKHAENKSGIPGRISTMLSAQRKAAEFTISSAIFPIEEVPAHEEPFIARNRDFFVGKTPEDLDRLRVMG